MSKSKTCRETIPCRFKSENSNVSLTKAYATEYLSLRELEGERKVQPQSQRLALITAAMLDGTFIAADVTISKIRIGREVFRGNGQHTCTARQDLGSRCPDYRVREAIYTVRDKEEAAKLYNLFDPQKAGRTYEHRFVMMNTNTGVLKLAGPIKIAKQFAMALAFEKGGLTLWGRLKIKSAEKIDLPRKHLDILPQFAAILTGTSAAHLMRDPVSCAILRTLRIDEKTAALFWTGVRDGKRLEGDDPAYKLREWLLHMPVTARGNKLDFGTVYSKCIHAWNATREGRGTNLRVQKVYRSGDLPVAR